MAHCFCWTALYKCMGKKQVGSSSLTFTTPGRHHWEVSDDCPLTIKINMRTSWLIQNEHIFIFSFLFLTHALIFWSNSLLFQQYKQISTRETWKLWKCIFWASVKWISVMPSKWGSDLGWVKYCEGHTKTYQCTTIIHFCIRPREQ